MKDRTKAWLRAAEPALYAPLGALLGAAVGAVMPAQQPDGCLEHRRSLTPVAPEPEGVGKAYGEKQ